MDECSCGASWIGPSPQERFLSAHDCSAYGPTRSRNRPVRTRTPGGVGAGELKLPGYPIIRLVSMSPSDEEPYFSRSGSILDPYNHTRLEY